MKSIPKLLRRFAAILAVSSVFLLVINFLAFALLVAWQSPRTATSPYELAAETGRALQVSDDGGYALPEEMSSKLSENHAWAILIDNRSLCVVWRNDAVPSNIPTAYTLSDIAALTTGYLDGYPTYTGENEAGIVVLGFPRDSFWKHTRASWNYSFISNLPQIVLAMLSVNIFIIFLIYLITNSKLLHSVKPIIRGIQDLSTGTPVHLPETGILCEISASLNRTSDILQDQQQQLRKKETARANWIAGVSHDIRTPLSMVMGYAEQLTGSQNLSETEQKKAAVIVRQSERMKNLINDLNLASKLEYNMQPLMKKTENAVAVVREVVVDFMNLNIDDRFPIKWETSDELSSCCIDVDRALLKRAVTNLIQNSINHNENGCTISVSVSVENASCVICIEDDGTGVSDEQIEKLNHTPHYMVCDTNTTEQRHGLGLLLVRQIVAGHGGETIIARSKHGGLKVTLLLPVCC